MIDWIDALDEALKPKSLTILVDMDGVINEFDKHFIVYIKSKGFGFDIDSYENMGDWNIAKFILGAEKPKRLMGKICSEMDFWDSIPPREDAMKVLKLLSSQYTIVIATSPWQDTDAYKDSKRNWIKKYFPFLKDIVFSTEKWTLNGDIIIEDKPSTLIKCKEVGMVTICCTQPYNLNIDCDYRFLNWDSVPMILNKIDRKGIQ